MIKSSDLKDLDAHDLKQRLVETKEELFNLRFQLATGQLDNPMRIKQVRHEIARLMTLLTERGQAGEEDEEAS